MVSQKNTKNLSKFNIGDLIVYNNVNEKYNEVSMVIGHEKVGGHFDPGYIIVLTNTPAYPKNIGYYEDFLEADIKKGLVKHYKVKK